MLVGRMESWRIELRSLMDEKLDLSDGIVRLGKL
jgi:hypothetical protein